MNFATTPKQQTQRQTPLWKRPAARIIGSALILAALLTVLPFDEMKDALGRVPWWVWPVAIVTYLSLHLIGVAKWRILINAAGAGLSFAVCARAYYWGLFGNTFLPSIVGGDVVKAGMAMRAAKSKSGLVLGSLVDRLLDVVGLAAIAGIGALLSPLALDPASRRIFVGLGALLFAAGVGSLVMVSLLPVKRFPYKVRRKLVQVRHAFRAIASKPGALVPAFVLGIALQSLLVVLNYWLGIVIGISIPLYVWLFVWPLAKIAGLLPVTQGGIGVREAAQAALFAPFGVSAVKAVATGIVFEVIIISGGLLGGAIAWVTGRMIATSFPEAGADVKSRKATSPQSASR
jgi:uncharacterized protein (TIRG00374 family)